MRYDPYCDGQVLVMHNMLGVNEELSLRFLRRYAHLPQIMLEAFRAYDRDFKGRNFPTEEESY